MADTGSNALSIMTSSLEGETCPAFRAGIYAAGLTIVPMMDGNDRNGVIEFAREGIYGCIAEKMAGLSDSSDELHKVTDAWTNYIVQTVTTPNIVLDRDGLVALATVIVQFTRVRFKMRNRRDQHVRINAIAKRFMRPDFREVHTFSFLAWLRKDVPVTEEKARFCV